VGVALRRLFVAVSVVVSGPAWAGESLINGEQLQYNHAYPCNGERVIVAHCRDNDDQSYCQVVYPDRPEQNGNQVAPVEMRGDIVAKLDACARPQARSVASDDSRQASPGRASGQTRVHPPATGAKQIQPPGLGHARWSMLFMNDDFAIYFVPTAIKRARGSGSGWFTSVYLQARNYPSAGLSNVVYVQTLNQADCSKSLIKAPNLAAFDRDGKLLGSGPVADATWDTIKAGSAGSREFNILCGRPQALQQKAATVGNHGDLMANYMKAELKVMEDATAPK
jgi:hypothetical protein